MKRLIKVMFLPPLSANPTKIAASHHHNPEHSETHSPDNGSATQFDHLPARPHTHTPKKSNAKKPHVAGSPFFLSRLHFATYLGSSSENLPARADSGRKDRPNTDGTGREPELEHARTHSHSKRHPVECSSGKRGFPFFLTKKEDTPARRGRTEKSRVRTSDSSVAVVRASEMTREVATVTFWGFLFHSHVLERANSKQL